MRIFNVDRTVVSPDSNSNSAAWCSGYSQYVCLLFSLLLSLCSCDASPPEERHPLLIRAENLRNGGRRDDALTLIEQYLKRFPDSPKAHLRAAELLHDKRDYVMAIYHYRRYLSLNPDAADKDLVPRWIHAAEKNLASSFAEPATPILATTTDTTSTEISRLSQEADSLRAENAKLTALAESLRQAPPAASRKSEELQLPQTTDTTDTSRMKTAKKPSPPPPKTPPAEEKKQFPTTYAVKDGDTLYMISKKMYGTTKHHNLIREANKTLIPSPTNLIIGQELKIPAPPPER